MKPLLIALLLAGSCFAQSPCKINFSVASRDELNNTSQGFTPKTLKWYRMKMLEKYRDVCYAPDAASIVLFFSSEPAVYHGSVAVSNSGTVTDTTPGSSTYGQQVATTTSTQQVPVEIDYEFLYLSVQEKQSDGNWKVKHTFRGKTLHPTYYYICVHNCHPDFANIEHALQWLHNGGLTDPTQSVAQ